MIEDSQEEGEVGDVDAGDAREPATKRRKVESGGAAATAENDGENVAGGDAEERPVLTIVSEGRDAVKLADVQTLVLYVLANGKNAHWAYIKNKQLVKKVALVFLPGLDPATYTDSPELFPNLRRLCPDAIRVYGLGTTATPVQSTATLLYTRAAGAAKGGRGGGASGGVDPTARRNMTALTALKKDNSSSAFPFPPSHYLVTAQEMADNNYPLPVVEAATGSLVCPPGFVVTQPTGGGVADAAPAEMVALDCEMSYTAQGLEVTRVSAVDAKCVTVYDRLVLPDNPITDYNTRHSGITAEMMAGVTHSLRDVQTDLLKMISQETILIGHSLENDLNALKILHMRSVDTALLYPHPNGPPYKPALRVLTERLLGRRIQAGSHDSVADAVATMELALLKFKKGPAFGEQRQEGTPVVEAIGECGKRATLIDRPRALTRLTTGSASAVACSSDADAASKAAKEARNGRSDFLWVNLSDLSVLQDNRMQRDRRVANGEAEAATDPQAAAAAQERVLRSADAAVGTIADALPPGSLLVVATGHGDTSLVRRLQEAKWRGNQGLNGGPWTEEDEAAFQAAGARARNGLAFVAIT